MDPFSSPFDPPPSPGNLNFPNLHVSVCTAQVIHKACLSPPHNASSIPSLHLCIPPPRDKNPIETAGVSKRKVSLLSNLTSKGAIKAGTGVILFFLIGKSSFEKYEHVRSRRRFLPSLDVRIFRYNVIKKVGLKPTIFFFPYLHPPCFCSWGKFK